MVLYHASQAKNLSVLTPQPTLSNDAIIGDFVFATKNKIMALMYLVPKGIPTLMNPSEQNKNIVICCNESDFKHSDVGGAIYKLSGKDFFETPQEGLSDYEMVSKTAVKPISKEVYPSSLDALLDENITVRFVGKSMFKNLIKNPKQEEIIQSIKPYSPVH